MATVYVSKAGSDVTGDGSQGNPYLTINHALSQGSVTTESYTVIIDDSGEYVESVADGNVTGTPTVSKYITIKASTGNTCNGIPGTGARIRGQSGHAVTFGKDYSMLEGIEVILDTAGSSDEGIRVSGDNCLISRSIIRTDNSVSQQDAIYTSSAVTLYIDNCIIDGFTERAGVHTQGSAIVHVDYCTIMGCASAVASTFSGTPTFHVYNTIGDSGSAGAYEDGGVGGTTGVAATWNGERNIADDASAEAKFTLSYDSVIFTDVEPSSGENVWFNNLSTKNYLLAGTNSFTVTQNASARAAPDSRQDFTLDIAYNTRTTDQIGAALVDSQAGGTDALVATGSGSLVVQGLLAQFVTDTETVTIDDFERADGALGANWASLSYTTEPAVIESGDAITGGAKCFNKWIGAGNFGRHQKATTVLTGVFDQNRAVGPAVYLTDSGGYHLATTVSHGGTLIEKIDSSGITTQLESISSADMGGSAFTEGESVTIEVDDDGSGNTLITVYRNGIQRATYTDTVSPFTSGQPGFWIGQYGAVEVESWEASDFSSGTIQNLTTFPGSASLFVSGEVPTIDVALAVTVTVTTKTDAILPNETGISWAWFDTFPEAGASPVDFGTGESTDSSGELTVGLDNTTLTLGQTGYLVIKLSNGNVGISEETLI